jgi:sialic acid synthase SpsE
MMNSFKINTTNIGEGFPTYFIADIAANHDGDLNRAIDLIHLSKECGANAAKFQHFKAETIVSDYAFKKLNNLQSHQTNWKKSVFEVYKDASVSSDWTPILKKECDSVGIDFFTSPYDFELVDEVDAYVSAYKIGSGDITWIELIKYIAKKNKPLILATGASEMQDVARAYNAVKDISSGLAILQCNTNYTASIENFKYVNLNVLNAYKKLYPDCILGLSDHTPGFVTVLGAIALGSKIVEKHFTDNNDRSGPDHQFSMNPKSWKEMIDRARDLEASLGDGVKRIESNELETSVVQRRAICASIEIVKDTILDASMLSCLRPCPPKSYHPFELEKLLGRKIKVSKQKGEVIFINDIE